LLKPVHGAQQGDFPDHWVNDHQNLFREYFQTDPMHRFQGTKTLGKIFTSIMGALFSFIAHFPFNQFHY
jgi:hypothetical protein